MARLRGVGVSGGGALMRSPSNVLNFDSGRSERSVRSVHCCCGSLLAPNLAAKLHYNNASVRCRSEIAPAAMGSYSAVAVVIPSLLALLLLKSCAARTYDSIYRVSARGRPVVDKNRDSMAVGNCPIYKNEALHAVMDRICDECHNMFRHADPNLRAKCRSNCFDNDLFTTCLAIFFPAMELVPPVKRTVRLSS
ncbi:hypothetical protein M513_06852 [Trichuris suis]|uniref:Crustacean CHH/MIH/GIH neurohormone family protein n=1 Tax=Trichuris suis TaxID=68888 RepID=A0A085M4Z3_9BILA|nr:hypothetical protein M513_06852 [Trichuris suis]